MGNDKRQVLTGNDNCLSTIFIQRLPTIGTITLRGPPAQEHCENRSKEGDMLTVLSSILGTFTSPACVRFLLALKVLLIEPSNLDLYCIPRN